MKISKKFQKQEEDMASMKFQKMSIGGDAVLEEGVSKIRQGVQCNLLFLDVEKTNLKCSMSHLILLLTEKPVFLMFLPL